MITLSWDTDKYKYSGPLQVGDKVLCIADFDALLDIGFEYNVAHRIEEHIVGGKMPGRVTSIDNNLQLGPERERETCVDVTFEDGTVGYFPYDTSEDYLRLIKRKAYPVESSKFSWDIDFYRPIQKGDFVEIGAASERELESIGIDTEFVNEGSQGVVTGANDGDKLIRVNFTEVDMEYCLPREWCERIHRKDYRYA